MMTQSSALRWFVRAALGGAVALAVGLAAATARSQPPPPAADKPAAGQTAPAPRSTRVDQEVEQQANQARERLEVMDAWLEAKRALLRIDESRAEQAKRWKAHYENLVRDGKVTEDRALAARDDLLMMEGHVEAERAELRVAEMRVRNARRHAAWRDQVAVSDGQDREDAAALEALLEAKRALLRGGESRAEQARRAEAHFEGLFRRGMATEDQVLAARDEVLMMDAALAWRRAELQVAELRVTNARRLASHGGTAADGVGRRLAELEERLIGAEMRADVLQHEVGRLRRELPRETHGAR
jgi:hypothetical protein